MKKYKKVSPNVAAEIKVMYQVHNIRGAALLRHFPGICKANVYKHARRPIGSTYVDGRKSGGGRPKKVSPALKRILKREVQSLSEDDAAFTSRDIQHNIGALETMCNRTVRRAMKEAGFHYLHLRKKGVLYPEDLVKRLRFAKRCKRLLPPDFWKKGISIYLDGVGFEYKRNPRKSALSRTTMGWRRKDLGLDLHFTAKGKKEGKKQAKFYVGISYEKGVVLCKRFTGKLNAERYCEIIVPKLEEALEQSSNPRAKRILQDNCPVMNAKATIEELGDSGIVRFKIPARSPDINCIENIFHEVRKDIEKDAIRKKIEKESFKEFARRAENIILSYPSQKIDKVIESMWRRIDAVIQRRGQRTKY